MKILIDIPKAFEVDYNADRFVDYFQRCIADMGTCCGNFELETAVMMEKAFTESKIYDQDKIVEQLEAEFKKYYGENWNKSPYLVKVIEIVKAGGTNDTH